MRTKPILDISALQQMFPPVETEYNGANVVVDAINAALIEAARNRTNLSLIARDEHCGIIKVFIDKDDSGTHQLCEANPTMEDFEDVIGHCEGIWGGRLTKKSVTEGTRYTFLMS